MIFSSFKNHVGYDERNYLSNGNLIIEEGLKNTKLLPVISLIFSFSSQIFNDNLMGIKFLYLLSLSIIAFVQYKFSLVLCGQKFPIIPVLITLVIPGILVLNIYSIGNLLSHLYFLALYFVEISRANKNFIITFLIGVFFFDISVRLDNLAVFLLF